MRTIVLSKALIFPLTLAAWVALPAPAQALDLGLRLEPGFAVPLSEPQSSRFDFGGSMTLKGYVGVGRYFDASLGFSFVRLNGGTRPAGQAGEAWSDSLGVRFKRPHDASPDGGWFFAASPWVDLDGLYVRTGGLDRFGFTAGAGVSFPLDKPRNFWVGPFVRYMQIVQDPHVGFDDRDASLLMAGISFEIGSSPLRRRRPMTDTKAASAADYHIGEADCPEPSTLSDRDGDGLLDGSDLCPDVAGTVENHGCRTYKRVVVKPDKLELTEKIMFESDRATIDAQSFPLLDDVVQALQDNKSFRVRIEGHADSSGPDGHNQTLSNDRAAAVLAYLESHGVAKDRLTSKGFSSSEPAVSNATPEGRETNRRVEFVINLTILDRNPQ